MFEMFSKSRPLLMNLILMNCVLGGSDGMRGKSLLNENAIIILSLNQSEWRKLLRSASSRIGFSLDTGLRTEPDLVLFLFYHKRKTNGESYNYRLLARNLRRGRCAVSRPEVKRARVRATTKGETTLRYLVNYLFILCQFFN